MARYAVFLQESRGSPPELYSTHESEDEAHIAGRAATTGSRFTGIGDAYAVIDLQTVIDRPAGRATLHELGAHALYGGDPAGSIFDTDEEIERLFDLYRKL